MGLEWLLGVIQKKEKAPWENELRLRDGAELDWILERMQAQSLYLNVLSEGDIIDVAFAKIPEKRETLLAKMPDGENLAPFAVIIDYLYMKSVLDRYGYPDDWATKDALHHYRELPPERKPEFQQWAVRWYKEEVQSAREENRYEEPMHETAFWVSMLMKRFAFKEQYFRDGRSDVTLNRNLFGIKAIPTDRQAKAFFDKLEGVINCWKGKLSEPALYTLHDVTREIGIRESPPYISNTVEKYFWLVEKVWDEHREEGQRFYKL